MTGISIPDPKVAAISAEQILADAVAHSDSGAVKDEVTQTDTDIVAFALANHNDVVANTNAIGTLNTDLNAFSSAQHVDMGAQTSAIEQVDTDLNSFASAQHVDMGAQTSAIGTLNSDLNDFAGANHTDLDTLNTSVGTLDTDVKAGTTALSGKLDTLDADVNTFAAANHTDMQALISAIQATVNLSGSLWEDSTVSPALYFYRRDTVNQGTGAIVTEFFDPAGVPAEPILANLTPVGANDHLTSETMSFAAINSGTGYSVGDILVQAYGVDVKTSPATVAYSFWLNLNTGLLLAAAPLAGDFQQAGAPLPVGAATSALQTQIDNSLQAILTQLGVVDLDLNNFATANHNDLVLVQTKLDTLDVSVQDAVTALGTLDTDVKAGTTTLETAIQTLDTDVVTAIDNLNASQENVSQTISAETHTATFTTTAGYTSLSIANAGPDSIVVGSATVIAGGGLNWTSAGKNTLGSIVVTISGTSTVTLVGVM